MIFGNLISVLLVRYAHLVAIHSIARNGKHTTCLLFSDMQKSNQTCATSVRPVPSPRGVPSVEVVHSGCIVYSSEYCGSSSSAVGTVTSLLITETVRDGTWLRGNSVPSFYMKILSY